MKEDAKTQKLKQYRSTWRPIFGKGTEEVVEMILEDKIDILVELTGHTAANRLDVCLQKPAPLLCIVNAVTYGTWAVCHFTPPFM